MFHVTKSSITIDKQITITTFVLLLMEILLNHVDHVFCFVFFISIFLKIFQYPPFFLIFFLYVSYIVQNPYHINDTAWISWCFSIVTIHVFLTICFMYVPYLLFNYALYIFVHIFTGVEMLCLFVYQLFIDLSCVFICNLDIFDNG